MNSARRLEYLRTIGIDVWVRRQPPAGASATASVAEAVPQPGSRAQTADDAAPVTPEQSRLRDETHRVSPESARPSKIDTRNAAASSRNALWTPLPVEPESLSPETEAEWEALRAEVLSCRKCALHATRTQGVFGVGHRRADWLIIGEAPGAEEDRQGEPFVGRAGQLLNAMLRAIGLQREQVFIANVLKSRPPNNRDPRPDEVAACLPYLLRQIALLQPKLMLAVGRIAAQNLLATDLPLGRLRGQVHTFGELNTPLIVTYHPAYLLRTPADKRKAWEDLKFARSVYRRITAQES